MGITIKEISKNLSVYLQRVQAGESFVVLQAGTPIAKMTPPDSLADRKTNFLQALGEYRARLATEGINIDSDEIFKDVRDRSPAPEEPRW